MFNPEEFMNTQQEGGEFDTTRSLIPAGEYSAVVEQLEADTVGERNLPVLKARYKLINTNDEALEGRLAFDTIWLDVDDRGSLMRGADKNLKLGQLLEAVGLNGKPWSPPMIQGQVVMIQVTQAFNKNRGEEENRVPRVTKPE